MFHKKNNVLSRNPWNIEITSQVLNELLREDGAVGPEAGKTHGGHGPEKKIRRENHGKPMGFVCLL